MSFDPQAVRDAVSPMGQLLFKARDAFEKGNFDTAVALARDVSSQAAGETKIARHGPAHAAEHSVIIVSHHPDQETASMLASLKPYALDPRFEFIFVDNGNHRLTEAAPTLFPTCTSVVPPCNLGCSGGRNVGAAHAQGRTLIFLDDDGVLDEGALEALIDVQNSFGATAVRGRVTPRTPGTSIPKHYDRGRLIHPAPPETEGISIWDRSAFLEFGGFDLLLAGHEGLHLCARMLTYFGPEAFLYAPDATLFHDFAADVAGSDEKIQSYERNLRYLAFSGINIDEVQAAFRPYRRKSSRQRLIFRAAPWANYVGQPRACTPEPISIITTARNAASFVDSYVKSLSLQTDRNFEVVFVDDGSQDTTTEALESAWALTEPLQLIKTKAQGRSAALNRALAAARHDLCLIADVDDTSVTQRLAWTRHYFAQNPSSACLAFRFFSNDSSLGIGRPQTFIGHQSLKARSFFGMPVCFPSFAFRKGQFREPFDPELEAGVDCDWLVRNFLAGATDGHLIGLIGTFYRRHDTQLTATAHAEQAASGRAAIETLHAHMVGPLNEEQRHSIAMLTGRERPRSMQDLAALSAYEALLVEGVAGHWPNQTGPLVDLLASRRLEIIAALPRFRRTSRKVLAVAGTEWRAASPSPSRDQKGRKLRIDRRLRRGFGRLLQGR